MRSLCLLLVLAVLAVGCVTPRGTYTVDAVQAAQVMVLVQQVIELAQAQGFLPPPGQQAEPAQLDYKERLLELLFAAVERNINDIDLSGLVTKANSPPV